MKHILFFFGIVCLLNSCSKTSSENHVLVRIHNQANVDFDSVFAINSSFGYLKAGSFTEYKSYPKAYDLPGANIKIKDTLINTGFFYCGTPPLPMLSNGRYTLAIFEDSITYSGYNARFIKE